MSYAQLEPETRQIAERILTRKQLDVFKLWCAGVKSPQIANMLDIAEPTARGTLKRAIQKIDIEKRKVAA